jgi:Phosphotransferase enzyme family
MVEIVGRTPDESDAAAIAKRILGEAPTTVRRFPAGLQHYVFEALYLERAVVVRIAADRSRDAMSGALKLSRLLRPLGVPLPAILAEGVDERPAWLLLERLVGTDLGALFANLGHAQLDDIARHVVAAQTIVGRTPSAGRYGYAVRHEDARTASGRAFLMRASNALADGSNWAACSIRGSPIAAGIVLKDCARRLIASPRFLSFTIRRRRTSSSRRTELFRDLSMSTIFVLAIRDTRRL